MSLCVMTSVAYVSISNVEQVDVAGVSSAKSSALSGSFGVYNKYAVATDAAQCSDIGR